MEDPPPPYSEVLADPRGGTYLMPASLRAARDPALTSETVKPPAAALIPDRGYSSLIRLPLSQRWDSLGHLLSNMDLTYNSLSPPEPRAPQAAAATVPRRELRTPQHGLPGETQGLPGSAQELQGEFQGLQGVHIRSLEPSCGIPTAFPRLGRSTAV